VNGYLLDTKCVSEAVKKAPSASVLDWIEATGESLLYVSVLTLGEIRKGVVALTHGKRRGQLETWLEVELHERFHGRVIPVDSEIADRWGHLSGELRRRGIVLPVVDGLLAATALHYNLTVVSRNERDFAAARVPVLNPWEA
jgi:toxin FitB